MENFALQPSMVLVHTRAAYVEGSRKELILHVVGNYIELAFFFEACL